MLIEIDLPELPLTPQALVSELRRELMMRARTYPKWVASNTLSQSDAEHRIRALDQVLAVVEAVFAEELEPPQRDIFA